MALKGCRSVTVHLKQGETLQVILNFQIGHPANPNQNDKDRCYQVILQIQIQIQMMMICALCNQVVNRKESKGKLWQFGLTIALNCLD